MCNATIICEYATKKTKVTTSDSEDLLHLASADKTMISIDIKTCFMVASLLALLIVPVHTVVATGAQAKTGLNYEVSHVRLKLQDHTTGSALSR
jgi:hypothetical protein